MTPTQLQLMRQPGSYSVDGNKFRVTNLLGMNSVLFEDISSISFIKCSRPNWKYLIYSFLVLFFFGILEGLFKNDGVIIGLGFLIFSGIMFYILIKPIRWENVIIETRGGMKLVYSVEVGEGLTHVDNIEKEKRKVTGIDN